MNLFRRLLTAGLVALMPALVSGCFLFGPQVTVPTLAPNATVIVDAEALTAAAAQPSDTPAPTASSTASRAPTLTAAPPPTSQPTAVPSATSKPAANPSATPEQEASCSIPVDPALTAAYQAAGGHAKLGCPAAVAADEQWAFQPFQQGMMLWRGPEKAVYLAYADHTFQIRADLWDESMPEHACTFTPPEGFQQPKRGFGLLWCEEAIRSRLGWAVLEETGVSYRVQRFFNSAGDFALLLVPAWGHVYAFYTDYTWADVMTIQP